LVSPGKASGIILIFALITTLAIAEYLSPKTIIPNVSAIETPGSIGVYWDKACTRKVPSIGWGVLSPSQSKKVTVYARNEGNTSSFLTLRHTNWNPKNASTFLTFGWISEAERLATAEVVKVTLSLYVSTATRGITTFSFDIIFEGSKYAPWDVNQDNKVDLLDFFTVSSLYGSVEGSTNWNPKADTNSDGKIDLADYFAVTRHYGDQYT